MRYAGRMRWLAAAFICGLCALAGALIAARLSPSPKAPETAAVVQRVREAARLETLDIALYKKIDFAPDPQPSDTT